MPGSGFRKMSFSVAANSLNGMSDSWRTSQASVIKDNGIGTHRLRDGIELGLP